MNNNIAINADGLGKRYSLKTSQRRHDTLIDLVAEGTKSLFRRDKRSLSCRDTLWVLKNASFTIERGENVGIIGMNGAGKSTLLKILSRITAPTTGRAMIAGRLSALLEVGTGFHWELTGRENIYLYSAILGMRKAETTRKFDSIVDFAGVDSFIDTPVKRYSSGMYVRLAFAVAAHLEPDILFLDEVLSVGDISFQRKCMEFTKNLQRANATILFISHNMFSIKAMCQRVIYLKNGEILFDGDTDQGIRLYEEDCRSNLPPLHGDGFEDWPITITRCSILDLSGREKSVFEYGERVSIRVGYKARKPLRNPGFIIAFVRSDGVPCCNYSTETDGIATGWVSGVGELEVTLPPLKLVSDLYTIHILAREPGFQNLLCSQVGSTFHVRHPILNTHFGVFHESAEWSLTCDDAIHQLARKPSIIG